MKKDTLYLYMMFHRFNVNYLASIITLFLLTTLSQKTFAQNFTDPVVYNNFLIEEQTKIITKSLEYMSFSIHSEDYPTIDRMRLQLISDIGQSIQKVSRMPDFRGTSKLKRETIDVFELYQITYQTDLLEVLGMKKKYKDSYSALAAYMNAEADAEKKLNANIERLAKAQEDFAKKYDLKVSRSSGKDELTERVDKISELSSYTRNVFMEYFAVSRKFNEMVNILAQRDGKLLHKRRLEVLDASKTALANLRKMKRFENESEYMNLTVDLIEFFTSLCKKEFSQVGRIFEKEAMNQKDADYVNKVFSDYNANIEMLVYNWNQANQYLWRDHVK